MLSRLDEIERQDKLNSLINMKTRNWNITKLSPDHFLCTYEKDKDGDERINTVKSIHIITKPDEIGRVFVKTDDLPSQRGTLSTYVTNSWSSHVSTFVEESLDSLAATADNDILELKDHFSNRFSDGYSRLWFGTMNHNVTEVKRALDDIATEGEAFLQYAIFGCSSLREANGQYIWKSISPFLYAAWSGDIRLVKLMLEYVPDYYQHEPADVLAMLIEAGTDQGPLMQPYLVLADKCKQLAASFKWNSGMTLDERLAALKQLGEAQSDLPLFGQFLLCDSDFYKPDYQYLDDSKRCRKINGAENWGGGLGCVESIWAAALGASAIIYIQKNGNKLLPSLGSLESTDRLPMLDGEAALFMAEALKRYYKTIKLELSNLILSCINKYDPDVICPLDNLVGFSSDVAGRGIRQFYPKHAFEDNQAHVHARSISLK